MSKGPPYRYEQGPNERIRGRFGPTETRREMGSPYKRLRRSSGSDFMIFGYDDIPGHRHQEVGLGNFNDFSAISRDTVLERDSKPEEKPPTSSERLPPLSVQIQNQSPSNNPASSTPNISPLTVKVSPTPHPPAKPLTPQKSASLMSSFQPTEHHFPHHPFNQQPTSPYRSVAKSSMQLSPRAELNSSLIHNVRSPYPTSVAHGGHPTGLLIQASSVDAIPSYTRASPVTPTKDEVYQPKVEAVSPSNSENEVEKSADETPKEVDKNRTNELLKQMEKVDKEIAEVEKKINDLKEKQQSLEEELSQEIVEPENVEVEGEKEDKETDKENEDQVKERSKDSAADLATPDPKEKSLIERIYAENRKKALAAHQQFAKLGIPWPNSLPQYHQPSDLPFYEENRKKAKAVKLKLIKYFQRKRKEKHLRQRVLLEEYRALEKKWLEKVEKMENNPKRKNKELRVRDIYEKIFPEIKRQREQTERFSRIGTRANWGLAARSEAEYNEILKDLTEKETHEKHMRDLAVDPPPLLDEDQRRVRFINTNGLITDLKAFVDERKMLNVWTDKEKEIFKEKYIQSPKDFEHIASFLENKSVKDCVLYYYRTKRTGKYKKLARKQSLKRKRMSNSTGKDDGTKSKILKSRTEAYRSESELDDDEAFDEDSDGSEGSSSRVSMSTTSLAAHSVRFTTSQVGARPEPVETPRWSKSEREIAIEGLRLHGRNWTAIAQMVMTKTDAQCKNFYFNYKKKLDLEKVVEEHSRSKIQRQESEETLSASEDSGDGYDGHNEEKLHSATKPKPFTRETRSQTAEKRGESTPGPSLRNLRPQRGTRSRQSDAKSCVLPRNRTIPAAREAPSASTKPTEHEKMMASADILKVSTVGSQDEDERPVTVDDNEEIESNHVQEGMVKSVPDSRIYRNDEHSPIQSQILDSVTSSSSVSTATHTSEQGRSSQTATSLVLGASQLALEISSGSHRSSSPFIKTTSLPTSEPLPEKFDENRLQASLPANSVKVDLPLTTQISAVCMAATSTSSYPGVPLRPILMDTRVHSPKMHPEPLLEMARNVASTVVRDENKLKVEEPENETEREKLKKIPRFPDPQLPKVEQKEAIGIFSRFSPCIPPDTTSRQQVRTQGFPPSSLHPTSSLMSSFVPHVGPHGPHFPVEMFPMSIARGPGYPLYPQFVEYFQHPGMDPEHLVPIAPFSARLMEEAALHQAHSMWSHFDRREMLFGAHPPYMIASDINRSTPPENVSRGRENARRESNSGVTPTRCRSVEAAVIHSRAHTPEHHILNDVRPGIQQRSFSLSDVHSRVTSIPDERRASPFHQAPKPLPQLVQTPKDQDSDHVKSYEPFNVLINAAAGAKPMKSVEKVSRSAQEHPTKPLKKEEAESSPTHFTRQSCVVTNTSVIHATSFDPRTIGRQSPSDRPRYGISTGLVPKPPPLMPITGLRSQSNPRQTESPDCGEVSVAEHATPFRVVKEAFSPCPNISEKAEIRPSHVMQTSPTYYPIKQQQHPPPLIRNTPLSENRVQSPLSMVKDCRCGNEPCKHQLYSQGVPYVQRGDNLPKMTSVEQENESVGHVSPAYTVPLNTRPADTSSGGSTPLFRPWIENLGAEKDVMKATESMTPSPNVFPSILEHSSPELSHISGGLSIYSGQNPVRPLHFTDVRVEISNSSPLEATSSTDPRKSLGVPHESFPRPSKRSPYQDASLFGLPTSNAPGFRSSALPGVACADTPISPLSQTSATLHTSSSFPGSRRTALLPSLSSRESLSTILVEADSVSGQSPSSQHECEHSSTADSCTVTSSEESLGRTASDQTVDKETDSDRGSNLEPSPGHESSDEIETGGQGETEVMPAGSKDPEELTSCYSSSESEDTVASKTLVASSGVVAPEVSIELNKPKELRKEIVEHSISNSDGISTSQSDTAFGDFFESSSADDNVDSSQSPNYTSRMQPAPAANTASGDPIREYGSDELQLRENKTGEELEDRELNSTRKDKMEVKDDSRATEEVMKSMEETELDSDKREKDLRDSGDNEESEVISGTGDEISLRNKAEEHNEAVNEVMESELEDKENDGGQNGEGLDDDMDDGVELRDKNYVPEDEVTSSMEHVNVRDSNGKDNKLLDDVREHEEDMRHDDDAEEAEVVSGTMNSCTEVRDNYDTDEGDIISDIQGQDKDVMQNDGTCEDESVGGIMNDEVKSSHSTPVKETEESETAIEGNDEMVKLEINEKEAGKKMDEMAESLSADEVVNIDENQETVEDNVYSLVESGMVVSEEEENTYSDKEEREDRTVDTSNVDPLSRIHNKSTVEEQCADSEKDKQHEECEVSSVYQQPDTKGKILVAYSCDQNEISKETGTTENDSGTDDVTGSDEPETMTTETSHVTTEPTSASPPNSVSGACISEKQDDVLSTSEIPSGQQIGSVDMNELCRGQDETSEVETTVDKIPFDSSAVNDLNKTQNIVDLDGRNDIGAEPRIDVEDTSNVESGECSEKSTTTNLNEDLSDHRELQPFGESDITETPSSGNEAESLVIIDQDHNSGETEKTVDTGSSSPARVTSANTELDKYGIKIEEISSDEEYSASELEEGEIAETPGNNDVTQTPDRVVESSDSYFPPLNTIPISPPGCDNHSEISHTAFIGWEHPYVHVHSSTEPLSENPNESTGLSDPTSSSRVSQSVPFPYSALNVRSAPNSGCSSPVPLSFTSGCSTPVIFQRQGSNTPLSEHYEPLSDDENGEHSKSDSESVRTLSESDDG